MNGMSMIIIVFSTVAYFLRRFVGWQSWCAKRIKRYIHHAMPYQTIPCHAWCRRKNSIHAQNTIKTSKNLWHSLVNFCWTEKKTDLYICNDARFIWIWFRCMCALHIRTTIDLFFHCFILTSAANLILLLRTLIIRYFQCFKTQFHLETKR